MQVTVEDLSPVKKKLSIEIPVDQVAREVAQAYDYLKKNVKVKGFRPGKAPRSVLERMYRKDVQRDVSSRLIQDSFIDAVKEKNLKILGEPQIDPPELAESQPYRYEATVEVNPEIPHVDFQGLTLKKNLYQVSDEEVDAQLRALQKNLTRHITLDEDRPSREGDLLVIDYEGFKDGQPFSETQKTENFTLKLGEGKVLKDFDDQLAGMRKTETREFSVTFPDDYFNAQLAGQTIDFKVQLNDIRKEEIPALDDAFAQRLGNYQTLAEVTDSIRENLRQGYEKRQEQELNEQAFEELLAKHPFDVPETLVEAELDGIYEELERSFAYQNRSLEDAGLDRSLIGQRYRQTAEKQVSRYLLLQRIIEQENLAVSDEDLENGFAEMAATMGHPVGELKAYYDQNPDKLSFFKHSLLEKKATKLILDVSQIDEVTPEKASQPDQGKE